MRLGLSFAVALRFGLFVVALPQHFPSSYAPAATAWSAVMAVPLIRPRRYAAAPYSHPIRCSGCALTSLVVGAARVYGAAAPPLLSADSSRDRARPRVVALPSPPALGRQLLPYLRPLRSPVAAAAALPLPPRSRPIGRGRGCSALPTQLWRWPFGHAGATPPPP